MYSTGLTSWISLLKIPHFQWALHWTRTCPQRWIPRERKWSTSPTVPFLDLSCGDKLQHAQIYHLRSHYYLTSKLILDSSIGRVYYTLSGISGTLWTSV